MPQRGARKACCVLVMTPAQSTDLMLIKGEPPRGVTRAGGPGCQGSSSMHCFAQVAATVRRMASATRRAVGRYSGSKTKGKGVS